MFPLMTALVEHRRDLDALEAAWHDELAECHRSGEWRAENYASAAALAAECRMDAGVAHAYVNTARKLVKIPLVAEAFRCGEISGRHPTVKLCTQNEGVTTPSRSADVYALSVYP